VVWSPTRTDETRLRLSQHKEPLLWRLASQPMNDDNEDPSADCGLHPHIPSEFLAQHRNAVESLMHKYGDKILKVYCDLCLLFSSLRDSALLLTVWILQIFHDHNFTFSATLEWQDLLERVGTDNPTADLLMMVCGVLANVVRQSGFVFFLRGWRSSPHDHR
jgi:hypothetical protein